MIILGVDFHPAFQRIALADTGTGEFQEKRLAQQGILKEHLGMQPSDTGQDVTLIGALVLMFPYSFILSFGFPARAEITPRTPFGTPPDSTATPAE
jgi:hypothetical protein